MFRDVRRFMPILAKLRGVAAGVSHFSTVLHISITESVGAALSYRRKAIAEMQEKARRRSSVASDCVTILAAENPQLKAQSRKAVLLAIDSVVKSKAASDRAAGRGDASSSQAVGRGLGRGRGRGSAMAHQGGRANSTQFPEPPFGAHAGPSSSISRQPTSGWPWVSPPNSKLIPSAEIRARIRPPLPPQNYGPRRQASAHLRPNGSDQARQ